MVSVTSVPNEIWFEIIAYVANDDSLSHKEQDQTFHSMSITCHQLNKLVENELWARILIEERGFASRLAQLLRTLDERTRVGRLVKSMDIITRGSGLRLSDNRLLTTRLLSQLPLLGSLSINAWFVDAEVLKMTGLHTIHLYFPGNIERAYYDSHVENPDVFPLIIKKVLTLPSLKDVTIEESELVEPHNETHLPLTEYFPHCLPSPTTVILMDSLRCIKRQRTWVHVIRLLLHALFATRLVIDSGPADDRLGIGFVLTFLSYTHAPRIEHLVLASPVTNRDADRLSFSADILRQSTRFATYPHLTSMGLTLDLSIRLHTPLSGLLPPNLVVLQLGFKLKSRTLPDFADAVSKILSGLGSIPTGAQTGLHAHLKRIICWTSHENRFAGTRAWGKLLKGLTVLWKSFDLIGVDLVWIPGAIAFEQTPLVTGKETLVAGAVDLRSRYDTRGKKGRGRGKGRKQICAGYA